MISGMTGYWRGIIPAWVLFFIAALICSIARLGFLPGLEHGWLPAARAATVLAILWPLPVLLVTAALVWMLPPSRMSGT